MAFCDMLQLCHPQSILQSTGDKRWRTDHSSRPLILPGSLQSFTAECNDTEEHCGIWHQPWPCWCEGRDRCSSGYNMYLSSSARTLCVSVSIFWALKRQSTVLYWMISPKFLPINVAKLMQDLTVAQIQRIHIGGTKDVHAPTLAEFLR